MNLLKNVEFRVVMNPVVAGTSDQTSSTIDTQGYDGVLIVGSWGVITAGAATSMRVQSSTDDSSYNDIAGSSQTVADTDDNKLTIVDLYRPTHRYAKAIMKRATQNAVINNVIAILYKSSKGPITQGTTVQLSKVLASPADGTA